MLKMQKILIFFAVLFPMIITSAPGIAGSIVQQSELKPGEKLFFGRIIYISKDDSKRLAKDGLKLPANIPYFDHDFSEVVLCFSGDGGEKQCGHALNTANLGPDDYKKAKGNITLQRNKIFSFKSSAKNVRLTDLFVNSKSLGYSFVTRPQPTINARKIKQDVVYLGDIILIIVDLGKRTPAPITQTLNRLGDAAPVFAKAAGLSKDSGIKAELLDLRKMKFGIAKRK